MSNIPNAKTDIKEALADTTGAGSGKLHIKSETPDFYLYRFYGYLEADSNDSIDVILIDTAGLVMDTLKSPVGISEDIGHMNIISTIYALTAMPSGTTDPLNTDSIATLSDSAKLKLLITAMVDLSLAHNSPQPDENEQSQGIFTNYMQFMDNVVGKWANVKNKTPGINRLQDVHSIIFNSNKVSIIDPVYIENRGTSFEEPSKTKRNNYAFYDGFSRINWDLIKPDYNTIKSGVGVMLRISQNVELYSERATSDDAIFDSIPILSGKLKQRRIIKANDSLLNILSNDENNGLWLKAISDSGFDKFYFGIVPVRLNIKRIGSTINIDSAFSLPVESKNPTDPELKVIKDGEKNILKMYLLHSDNGKREILENASEPELMLHGQKRSIEYDSTYFDGDFLEFRLIASDQDKDKMFFTDSTKFKITLSDTSSFDHPWHLDAISYKFITDGFGLTRKIKTRINRRTGHNGKICLKDALDGTQCIWGGDEELVAVAVETNTLSWIRPKRKLNVEIKIEPKDAVRIYKSRSAGNDDEIYDLKWPWQTFRDSILRLDSLYVLCRNNGISTVEFKLTDVESYNDRSEKLKIFKPSMDVLNCSGKDLTNDIMIFNPKPADTAKITIRGLHFKEFQDTVSNVKIDICYDYTNGDHNLFYGSKVSSGVVRSMSMLNISGGDNITLKFDGRDSIDNRILIEGKYKIRATVNTIKGKEFKISKEISISKPVVVSLGPLYYPLGAPPTLEEEWIVLDTLLARDQRGEINWNAVPFLNRQKHSNFYWVFNPYITMGFTKSISGYDIDRLDGRINGGQMLDILQNRGAILRITGHHSGDTILNRTTGVYQLGIFEGNLLFADVDLNYAEAICDSGSRSINYRCGATVEKRDSLYLDDVLLATAIGCGTDNGASSITKSLVNHGVDCVIGTPGVVLVEVMNFWNYYFWDELNKGKIVLTASIDAYTIANEKLIEFLGVTDLYQYYSDSSVVHSYFEDITKREGVGCNVWFEKVLPARYGKAK